MPAEETDEINWKERAEKAEAELAECYDEIFWTVPEAMPLKEKIIKLREMEVDAILRDARSKRELEELRASMNTTTTSTTLQLKEEGFVPCARCGKFGWKVPPVKGQHCKFCNSQGQSPKDEL